MGNRILKTFTNNIGYKILAVAFAFILWLVVYNLNDPVKTKTFTTTVSVTGKEAVVDMGKWPTIKESDKTVTLKCHFHLLLFYAASHISEYCPHCLKAPLMRELPHR